MVLLIVTFIAEKIALYQYKEHLITLNINRKTKTNELLLIKYIKIKKLFAIESHHQVCTNFKIDTYLMM